MTVRTVDLGGTDWSDGEILYAADLNDTFNYTTIHRYSDSDGTERSTTSTSFTASGTSFSLVAPVNSIVIGVYVKCLMKVSDNAEQAYTQVEFNGTNLGSIYVAQRWLTTDSASSLNTRAVGWDTTNTYDTFLNSDTSYQIHFVSAFMPLKLLDATTSIIFNIKSSNGANTAYLDNVEVQVLYLSAFVDD